MKLPYSIWLFCWLVIGLCAGDFTCRLLHTEHPPPCMVCHGEAQWEDLGELTITYYAQREYPGPTAWKGIPGTPYATAAIRTDCNIFKFGDVVYVEGEGYYLINDTGNFKKAHLDLMVTDIPEALRKGKVKRRVWRAI